MAQVEDDIVAAGIELIWVLEKNATLQPGTAKRCRNVMDGYGSSIGWCVGDSETQPTEYAFDNSDFSQGRGFDMLVMRDSMEIVFSTNHGTPDGNENLTGAQVLAEVQEILNAQ